MSSSSQARTYAARTASIALESREVSGRDWLLSVLQATSKAVVARMREPAEGKNSIGSPPASVTNPLRAMLTTGFGRRVTEVT